ncbi:MAG: flagellar basal-body rod protein FlgF [Alphaproteobacteria bacterium]|nr:flagellar basal-body rod protein FlgF [Alphaproteobacteria bacterium]
MENSIYVGLSRQIALKNQMGIIANNVANMSTPGYRAQNMVFTEYIEDPRDNPTDPLSMVLDYGQFQTTQPGPISQTGASLDVALQGPGYIGVQTPDGTTMYTRAGNFQINAGGQLVTGNGYPVSSAGGGILTFPSNFTEIKIDDHGFINTDQGLVGQIMVTEFDDLQALEATGNGLYKAPNGAGLPAQETLVKQGMLEGSNVTPVLEMTRMIDVLRAYQSTQQMLQNEHERQRAMIRKLTEKG